MLAAWDTAREILIALPDFEDGADLTAVRERARGGELVCPACRAMLWLRAGEVRLPHFAHRKLSDCPSSRVSLAVLEARQMLYRFFKARIESGRLPGSVELEPVMPEGWPVAKSLDLVVRGDDGTGVAVLLCDRGLKPELRTLWRQQVGRKKWVFRPVFLVDRLVFEPADERQSAEAEARVLLDPTQRAFRLCSPYDLQPGGGTLHFVDATRREWITLRGLTEWHAPQVFKAARVLRSPMASLLWSGRYSEWVHPGEAEALRAHREAEREAQRQAAREKAERRRAEKEARRRERLEMQQEAKELTERMRRIPPARPVAASRSEPEIPSRRPEGEVERRATCPPAKGKVVPVVARPELLPAWIREGLRCVGCGRKTVDWQNADTGKEVCVCKDCFAKGVRLDGIDV